MYNINGNTPEATQTAPFSGLQVPSAPQPTMPGLPSGLPTSSGGGSQAQQGLLQDIVALTAMQKNPLINQNAVYSALTNDEQQLGAQLGGMSPEQQMMGAIQNGMSGQQQPQESLGNLTSLASFGGQQQMPFGGQQQMPFGGQQQMPFGGQQQMSFGGQQQMPFGGQQQMPFGGQQQMPYGVGGMGGPQLQQPMVNAATPGFAGPGLNTQDSAQAVGSGEITTNGDPHIASNIDGKQSWSDNQGSQSDFVDANTSFAGGYQESTQVGNAGKDGKAYNKEIDFQVGGAQVTATGTKGDVSVSVKDATGSAQTLSKGGSITTADGATIALDGDGKLNVTDNNQTGGTLTTTVSTNGHGLDATSSGSGINLGGFAASQNQQGVQSGSGHGKKDIGI